MRETTTEYATVIEALRRRYWQSLPTRAFRIRQLVRAARSGVMQPGEREELELMAQRLSESGATYGFNEITQIAGKILDTFRSREAGDRFALLERCCDELDRFIDDMSLDALALRLRGAWRG